MNRNDFLKLIKKSKKIGLDTNVFIYQFQIHEKYSKLTKELFLALQNNKLTIVSSFISLVEILAFSKLKDNEPLINSYKTFLLKTDGLNIIFPNISISEKTAQIKREYRFKIPDAIQLATCIEEKTDLFITNDTYLNKFRDMQVICLSDFI
jgi:predicted nucleic acid-binding protein